VVLAQIVVLAIPVAMERPLICLILSRCGSITAKLRKTAGGHPARALRRPRALLGH
jgi:hypothetical protein